MGSSHMKIFPDKIVQKAKPAYQSGGVADANYGQTTGTMDIGSPKEKTKNAESHTAPTKYGMGTYFGTGFKAPVGKLRSDTIGIRPVTKKQLGTPPRSVV